MRLLLTAAILSVALPAAAAKPAIGVGELTCGGKISAAACSELTERLVEELAKDPRYEVIRQSEVRDAEKRCEGDAACLRKHRRVYAKVVSGTVQPRSTGNGHEVWIRLLDARKMSKEAEASEQVPGDGNAALRSAVGAAASSLRKQIKR